MRYLLSGSDDSAYKRVTRVINVPAGGGRLSFYVTRNTEPDWDYFFVEAHPVGSDAWTTLRDLNGHTSRSTGDSCPYWLEIHPFLTHYQTDNGDDTCGASGTSGQWHAASGASDGYERWTVDLSAYAGRSVEVALSAVGDDSVALPGVYVDDVVGPNGQGTTSFEPDGNPMDGWTVPGPPAGSPGNESDWQVLAEDPAPTTGDNAAAALARQPEIIRFLSGVLGRYPFRQAGGIVDNDPDIGFALENQTRPIYAQGWFDEPGETSVVVHELAHQWTGDDLTVARWRHIWLNEGFASYMEWLWSEHQGEATAQEFFDAYAETPVDDAFWNLAIGNPGPEEIFNSAVCDRGAMTLHALRMQIGDDDFFRLLKRWTASQSGGHVTTAEFRALAERVSGEDLEEFFQVWLFTAEKPAGLGEGDRRARSQGLSAELQKRMRSNFRR